MTFRNCVSAVALMALLAGPVAAAAAASPPPSTEVSAFDAKVTAAKSAMMADPKIALDRSVEAMAIAKGTPATDQPIQVATSQWLQGEALMRLGRAQEAGPIIDQALAVVAVKAPNTKLHGDLTMAQGGILARTGKTTRALEVFQKAFTIFRLAGEARGQAKALQYIGSIYQEAGDYNRVLQYYAQSAEVYQADPVVLMSAYNNQANALKALGRLPEAEAKFKAALAIAREMGSPLLEASILSNLASTEVMAGRFGAADASIARGLRLTAGGEAAQERPYFWGVAAQAAQRRGDYPLAIRNIERVFAGLNLEETPGQYRDFHKVAYEVYARAGDTRQAFVHLRAFKRLDDEAKSAMADAGAALLAARFDFANQDLKIAKLKAGQLERDIQLARSRNMISLGLLGGSTIVLILVLFAFFSIRRSRNEVRAANVSLNTVNTSLEKALKAKTDFLATTSHEIRTPLNGILGMTQVLLSDPKVDTGLRDKISLVQNAGETMRALVDDILDMAKIETGNLQIERSEIDLRTILAETGRFWADRAEGKGLQLRLDIAGAPARIVEDGTRLRQILFNLMSNAIKFTDEGAVDLSAGLEDHGDRKELVLRVSDTGIGIPRESFGVIFESFSQVDTSVTRTYGGTGLGLAICQELTAALGGEISVESELGQGSTFTVRLPCNPVELREPARVAEAAEGPPAGLAACSLLLVEANPLAQGLLRAVLQPKVRALEIVSSGAAALAALSTQAFDRIVADADAVRIDGEDAADSLRRLAAVRSQASISLLCVSPSDEDIARFTKAGAGQIIAKPISAAGLLAALQAASRSAETPDATMPSASVSAA
jgi:signal transduction histidine kinase/ActR/RegA family two-component response regulator